GFWCAGRRAGTAAGGREPAQQAVPGHQGRQAWPYAGPAASGGNRVTRGEVRRRLALQWWRLLGLALAPLFLANLLFGAAPAWLSVLQMPLFIAALASLFVSLPLFRAYKHALIATGQALDSEAEPAAWQQLIHCRRRAL